MSPPIGEPGYHDELEKIMPSVSVGGYIASWALAVSVVSALMIYFVPEATIETWVLYGGLAVVISAFFPHLSHLKYDFKGISYSLLSMILGFSGIMAYVLVSEMYFSPSTGRFMVWNAIILFVVELVQYYLVSHKSR